MTGADVVTAARAFVGVRYRHQGRSREGLDCIGLPVAVRATLSLEAIDASGYARRSTEREMLDFCREHLLEVMPDELQPGDILVQITGTIRHMAIVADYPGGGLSVIHAWLPARKIVENRLDDEFMKTVRGCFRFQEVAS